MKPQAVYDTNVIVSAILKPGSIPASLVSLAMRGEVQLFLSPALLAEYTAGCETACVWISSKVCQ